MKEQVKKYIIQNFKNITLLLSIYVVSVIIGFIIYVFLSHDIKNELITSVTTAVNLVKSEGFKSINIITNGLQNNTVISIILIFSSFTVVTFFLIASVFFAKGVSLAIYICMLFSVFGPLKGILATILVAIIPNLIFIISYIFLANECYLESFEILSKVTQKRVIKVLFKNVLISFCIIPFIILATWLEQVFFRLLI